MRKVSPSIRICKRTSAEKFTLCSVDAQISATVCPAASCQVNEWSQSCQWRLSAVRPKQRRCRIQPSINNCCCDADLPSCTGLGMPAARAQDASDWDAQTHTAARLIAGSRSRRPTRRFCAPASRSSSIPAGRPIGAIPAIPACRRHSISPDRTTLNPSPCCGPHRSGFPTAPAAIRSVIWITSFCRCGSRRKTPRSNRRCSSSSVTTFAAIMCVPVEAESRNSRSTATAPKRRRSRKRKFACRGASRSAKAMSQG